VKNYRDSLCIWGYITLCDSCAGNLSNRDKKHIDVDEPLDGLPLMKYCEMCDKED